MKAMTAAKRTMLTLIRLPTIISTITLYMNTIKSLMMRHTALKAHIRNIMIIIIPDMFRLLPLRIQTILWISSMIRLKHIQAMMKAEMTRFRTET